MKLNQITSKNNEYFVPPEHIRLGIIANTPMWVREYFRLEEFGSERRDIIYNPDGTLTIATLEGNHTAQKKDWIIRGVKGEIYPCKPDIFEQTYEEVKPNSSHK